MTEALEQRRILQLTGAVAGLRVVDLGCGDGLLTATLARQGASVVGVDIDRSALRAGRTRAGREGLESAHFIEGRIECLPLADGGFDLAGAVTTLGASFIAVAATKDVRAAGTRDRRRS